MEIVLKNDGDRLFLKSPRSKAEDLNLIGDLGKKRRSRSISISILPKPLSVLMHHASRITYEPVINCLLWFLLLVRQRTANPRSVSCSARGTGHSGRNLDEKAALYIQQQYRSSTCIKKTVLVTTAVVVENHLSILSIEHHDMSLTEQLEALVDAPPVVFVNGATACRGWTGTTALPETIVRGWGL